MRAAVPVGVLKVDKEVSPTEMLRLNMFADRGRGGGLIIAFLACGGSACHQDGHGKDNQPNRRENSPEPKQERRAHVAGEHLAATSSDFRQAWGSASCPTPRTVPCLRRC